MTILPTASLWIINEEIEADARKAVLNHLAEILRDAAKECGEIERKDGKMPRGLTV